MTDRLSLTNALAEAKIERAAAERIATEIFEAIHDSVATKADLQRLDAKIDAAGARLDAKIDAVAARLEAKMDATTAALRGEMALLEHRLLIRLGSLVVIVAGLLFAALRYLPPPH